MNTTFDDQLAQAWEQHGDAPQAVADRLPHLAGHVSAPAQLQGLARLSHHVWGAHLHDWPAGRRALQALPSQVPAAAWDEVSRLHLHRFQASLALCAGDDPAATLQPLPPSEQVQALALAAANLAACDTTRAQALLQQAVDKAQPLPASDPCMRTLAICSNNLACDLEEKPQRTPAERALMINAAQAGRSFWALAGGWLELERAEYRLSNTWRLAGDAQRARQHAQACLGIVQQHQNPPLEAFFGFEALALAEQALGSVSAHAAALAQARNAFEQLPADDQAWCRATLLKLGVQD